MKSQKIAISVLVSTALILSVLLVLLPQHPRFAAAAMSAVSRDWIMITSDQSGAGGDELVTVIDSRNLKMATYGVKSDGMQAAHIVPVAGFNVAKAFAAPAAGGR